MSHLVVAFHVFVVSPIIAAHGGQSRFDLLSRGQKSRKNKIKTSSTRMSLQIQRVLQITHTHTYKCTHAQMHTLPPCTWEDLCEWHRMTSRMSGLHCAVMCNSMNKYKHIHTHTRWATCSSIEYVDYRAGLRGYVCVCVCVFFPFILDFNGRTSRGHTGRR